MSKIEILEREIELLSQKELKSFREWFASFDSELWDQQIESDITTGKLDMLAKKALTAHKRGESTEF